MWQIYGGKETCGTWGGLVSKRKQSMKLVVTTNGEKSAEVIVPRRLQTSWEGLNFRRYKLRVHFKLMNRMFEGGDGDKLKLLSEDPELLEAMRRKYLSEKP